MLKSTRRIVIAAMIALMTVMTFAASPAPAIKAQSPNPTATAQPTVRPEFEFVGAITAINGTKITVSLQVVETARAEVKVQLRVGMMVKVHGWLEANNTITAREVELPAATDTTSDAEFRGVVEQINGTMVVVSGRTVDISKAEVKNALRVGMVVKVHIVPATVGSAVLIASEIEASRLDLSRRGSGDDMKDDRGRGRGSDDDHRDDRGSDDDDSGKGHDSDHDDSSGKGSDDSNKRGDD